MHGVMFNQVEDNKYEHYSFGGMASQAGRDHVRKNTTEGNLLQHLEL